MKHISLFTLIMVLVGCQYQKRIIIEAEMERFIPGRCHASNSQPNGDYIKFERFTLEVVNPTFKSISRTYYLNDYLNENKEFKEFQHVTQEPSLEFIISDKHYRGFTKEKYPKSYSLCLIEKGGLYETVKLENFIDEKFIAKTKVLDNGPRIIKTYVKRKPINTSKNVFYFEGNNWSSLREIVYGSN